MKVKVRKRWAIKPYTKVIPVKKKYNRARAKTELMKEIYGY